MIGGVTLAALLSGCGVAEVIRATDNRYLQPGALDLLPTGYYDTYQFKFLDRYRITHQWITTSGCSYRTLPIPKSPDRYKGVNKIGRDIYEEGNSTWQRFEGMTPLNFDMYTRPEYTLKDGTKMKGFQAVCFEAWQSTDHFLSVDLRKQTVDEYLARYKTQVPGLTITTEQIGNNRWIAAHSTLHPPSNRVSGPFETWLLSIGDSGYIFVFDFGANTNSLKYPTAHAKMQAAFRHLIESVKIEPLQ